MRLRKRRKDRLKEREKINEWEEIGLYEFGMTLK